MWMTAWRQQHTDGSSKSEKKTRISPVSVGVKDRCLRWVPRSVEGELSVKREESKQLFPIQPCHEATPNDDVQVT